MQIQIMKIWVCYLKSFQSFQETRTKIKTSRTWWTKKND